MTNFQKIIFILASAFTAAATVALADAVTPTAQTNTTAAAATAATTTAPITATTTTPAPLPTLPANTSKTAYCPNATELTQNADTTWHAGKNWRGYEQTVATEIQGFIGAQWTGVKIGKIICLYQAQASLDFPISLEQKFYQGSGSSLVLEPTTDNWSAPVQNYRFCKSNNPIDCPFYKQRDDLPQTGAALYEGIKYNPIKDTE